MEPARIRLPSGAEATCVAPGKIAVLCAGIVLYSLTRSCLRRGAFPGPVELDLGNLLAYEPRGPSEADLKKDATAACIAHGRDVLQKLVVRAHAHHDAPSCIRAAGIGTPSQAGGPCLTSRGGCRTRCCPASDTSRFPTCRMNCLRCQRRRSKVKCLGGS